MAFNKRIIKDRTLQFPKRYRLNLVSGETNVYDLEQITGTVVEAGTAVNTAYLQPLEDAVANLPVFQTATGTATAITIDTNLINGYSSTFIVSASNSGATTTINGKPLYKPATTTSPVLTSGKAVTVWYSTSGNCFFIKASAEGNAVVANVLASKTFSNDTDTGLVGTMPNNSGFTTVGANVDGVTTVGRIYMKPSIGYYDGVDDLVYADDPDFVASNFLATKNVFGLQGSIPVKADYTASSALSIYTSAIYTMVPYGFYAGGTWLSSSLPNLTANNIKKDVVMQGTNGGASLVGTLIPLTDAILNLEYLPYSSNNDILSILPTSGTGVGIMYLVDGYVSFRINDTPNFALVILKYSYAGTLLSTITVPLTPQDNARPAWVRVVPFGDRVVCYIRDNSFNLPRRCAVVKYDGTIVRQFSFTPNANVQQLMFADPDGMIAVGDNDGAYTHSVHTNTGTLLTQSTSLNGRFGVYTGGGRFILSGTRADEGGLLAWVYTGSAFNYLRGVANGAFGFFGSPTIQSAMYSASRMLEHRHYRG